MSLTLQTQLFDLLGENMSLMAALHEARAVGLPNWAVGAGAIRNLVWDHLHGFAHDAGASDIDLIYFDDRALPTGEAALQLHLRRQAPHRRWDVTNQARVHEWLPAHGDSAVAPFSSLSDAIASWPETATAVAVWLKADDRFGLLAPYGLDDLFSLVLRRSPGCNLATYRQRLDEKRFTTRWPHLRQLP
jgi:hypothetical protein